MTVEILRDLEVRLRGVAFEGWLEGAGSVEVRLLDRSLLGAACALPVIEAVRALGLPVAVQGDGVGIEWLRLATRPGPPWRGPTRSLVLDPARRVAKVRDGELLVPCARAHRPETHPMERWARGALAAGLPASRQAPRVELGFPARREARSGLRAQGVKTPLVMLAPASGRSGAMSAVGDALRSLPYRVMPAGEVTPSTLQTTLARATLATVVIGDDAGLLHAAAACGAHTMTVGKETPAPPYPSATWVRMVSTPLLVAELERVVTQRFPWDALALYLP